mmetsp:Transcript_11331/g.31575  ORF Transcript_11331/g.31575 Transcript_11331/m.31575 type:complete len:314 (+) Transcript_11331:177-1118(+)
MAFRSKSELHRRKVMCRGCRKCGCMLLGVRASKDLSELVGPSSTFSGIAGGHHPHDHGGDVIDIGSRRPPRTRLRDERLRDCLNTICRESSVQSKVSGHHAPETIRAKHKSAVPLRSEHQRLTDLGLCCDAELVASNITKRPGHGQTRPHIASRKNPPAALLVADFTTTIVHPSLRLGVPLVILRLEQHATAVSKSSSGVSCVRHGDRSGDGVNQRHHCCGSRRVTPSIVLEHRLALREEPEDGARTSVCVRREERRSQALKVFTSEFCQLVAGFSMAVKHCHQNLVIGQLQHQEPVLILPVWIRILAARQCV